MGCFTTLFLLAVFIFVVVSVIRWFEQVTEAVDQGWWNKVTVLVAMPFTVWFFPSRVSAGRPTAVPHHEPVLGFGMSSSRTAPRSSEDRPTEVGPPAGIPEQDSPPPGTPKEFLGMPKIPPKPRAKSSVDPEKLAKLKEKMRQQGMLPPEDSE